VSLWLPDPRWESGDLMAGRKPRTPVIINPDISFEKLTGAYLLNWSDKSIAENVDLLTNTGDYSPVGVDLSNSGDVIELDMPNLLSGAKDTFTVTCVYRKTNPYGGSYPRLFESSIGFDLQSYRDNSDTVLRILNSSVTVNTNIWDGDRHIFTIAYRKADNSIYDPVKPKFWFYIDGVLEYEDEVRTPDAVFTSGYLRIGNRSDGKRYNGGGNESIFVHDGVLSAGQVSSLHANIYYKMLIPA